MASWKPAGQATLEKICLQIQSSKFVHKKDKKEQNTQSGSFSSPSPPVIKS